MHYILSAYKNAEQRTHTTKKGAVESGLMKSMYEYLRANHQTLPNGL